MKQNLTYLIFVVDRSGSMQAIALDMIGGFNSFIKTQKELPGEARVFFYQFDTKYETVYENVPLADVAELTDKTFTPRGSTALYSSLGKTIVDMGKRLSDLPESERPERVLVITITDGEDNAPLYSDSVQYTSEQVKALVKQQTDVYSWDFAYIGANQDAWAVGGSMGVGNNLNYQATSKGTAAAFATLNSSTSVYRSAQTKGAFAFHGVGNTNSTNDTNIPKAKKSSTSKKATV